MERCSPHAWRTPVVGDAALVCDVCESRLDLAHDITPEVLEDILRNYRRYHGPVVGQHFQAALEAAVAAVQSDGSGRAPPPVEEGSA